MPLFELTIRQIDPVANPDRLMTIGAEHVNLPSCMLGDRLKFHEARDTKSDFAIHRLVKSYADYQRLLA